MNSLRQMLLGTSVFIGGSILLYAMVHQDSDTSTDLQNEDTVVNLVENDSHKQSDLTVQNGDSTKLVADVDTEARILEQKRKERTSRLNELDKKTKEYLLKQEEAEVLAMQKARLENQKYRDSAIEAVMDEPVDDVVGVNKDDETRPKPNQKQPTIITKPIVQTRIVESEPLPSLKNDRDDSQSVKDKESPKPAIDQEKQTANTTTVSKTTDIEATSKADKKNNIDVPESVAKPDANTGKPPTKSTDYTVQRGDGLIKLARQYNVPVKALAQANGISTRTNLSVGQEITIPAASELSKLVTAYDKKKKANPTTAKSDTTADNQQASVSKPKPKKQLPPRQLDYEVKSGDALIRLAREYDIPVSILADANDMSTRTNLQVGQQLIIPSRKQVARLKREAEQRQAERQSERSAQQRLNEARRAARKENAKGKFGVQVALANDQDKADDIVKELRAAGYKASTSKTSRGVRVMVGPERGKEAALALKDKINADKDVKVNDAWVLYWR